MKTRKIYRLCGFPTRKWRYDPNIVWSSWGLYDTFDLARQDFNRLVKAKEIMPRRIGDKLTDHIEEIDLVIAATTTKKRRARK